MISDKLTVLRYCIISLRSLLQFPDQLYNISRQPNKSLKKVATLFILPEITNTKFLSHLHHKNFESSNFFPSPARDSCVLIQIGWLDLPH